MLHTVGAEDFYDGQQNNPEIEPGRVAQASRQRKSCGRPRPQNGTAPEAVARLWQPGRRPHYRPQCFTPSARRTFAMGLSRFHTSDSSIRE